MKSSKSRTKAQFPASDTAKFEAILAKYEANPNDQECQYNLACCYHWRIGTEQDYSKAAALYEKARHGEFWQASVNLGILHLNGSGVKKDDLKAAALLKVGAAHGDVNSMAALGGMFMGAVDTEHLGLHPEMAIEWLRKTEAANHASGTHNLGMAYLLGRGVEKNRDKATELLKKSHALGNELSVDALLAIALMMTEEAS